MTVAFLQAVGMDLATIALAIAAIFVIAIIFGAMARVSAPFVSPPQPAGCARRRSCEKPHTPQRPSTDRPTILDGEEKNAHGS